MKFNEDELVLAQAYQARLRQAPKPFPIAFV